MTIKEMTQDEAKLFHLISHNKGPIPWKVEHVEKFSSLLMVKGDAEEAYAEWVIWMADRVKPPTAEEE